MTEKIRCPYTESELRKLYCDDRLGVHKIAKLAVIVDGHTVCRWLREYGIEIRPNGRAKKVECPYSDKILHRMYWLEGKSPSDIAELASELIGQKICSPIAARWLKEAGFTLRTISEAVRLLHRNNPEFAKRSLSVARSFQDHNALVRNRVFTPEERNRLKKASRKQHRESLETRPCSLCGKDLTRQKHKFTSEYAYCCRSHKAKHQAQLRRERRGVELMSTANDFSIQSSGRFDNCD